MNAIRFLGLTCALLLTVSPSSGAKRKDTTAFFLIQQDGKWGYIDKTGSIVIKPEFEEAFPYSEGLAAVRVRGKWGYVNDKGNMIINPRFDLAAPFSEGSGLVVLSDKVGYV